MKGCENREKRLFYKENWHFYFAKNNKTLILGGKFMEKPTIKKGKLTEKKLVELYGSEAQKKSYKENGRFVSNYKKTLLTKMSRYCTIKDLGDRTYKITNVYDYPLPANFNKMTKSLYQYIVPLLLTNLINGHDENNKIDITVGKWAREINMVNKNYNLVKYNKEDTSKETQCSLDTINEFYDKADDMIEWYITNALDYLKSAGLIIWREVYRVSEEISSGESVIDEHGNIHVDISIESHQASEDEMNYYSHCVSIADKAARIENAGERYYSKKSKLFGEVLKRELYKKKIKCVFKTYEAYYVNLDKCNFVLDQFGNFQTDNLIGEFNEEFTKMLIENAGKRFDKNPNKYISYSEKDDYTLCFQNLCEITIDKNTEYLGHRIREKTIDDDYSLKITPSKKG
jgi:hypothetical protein